MRLSYAILGLACGGLAASGVAGLLGPPSPGRAHERADPPTVAAVDERRADFREDESPSRVVASLSATLTRVGRGARFRLVASALGPHVVAPPGFEGVAGGNEIAARELRAVLACRRAEVVVRRDGAIVGRGRVSAGRDGIVPVRRLGSDGRVREGGRRRESEPVEAVFEADLRDGPDAVVEVVVDGRVRTRAVCRVRPGATRIRSLEGVAGHALPHGAP